jgi:Mg/Co/Ni transporter MgtE
MTDCDLLAAPVVAEHKRVIAVITADDVLELMTPDR